MGARNHLAAKAARTYYGPDEAPDGDDEAAVTVGSDMERAPVETPPTTPDSVEALQLARRVVDLAADKQASDIVLLDIRGVSLIADYFVICTVGSERQASAILKDLADKTLEEFGRKPLHQEGTPDSGWVLLDYGDVIVHVFSSSQREFYKLEGLWATATPVVRLQ